MKTNFGCWFGSERLVKLQHGKLSRIKDLIAKLAVTLHTQDFEVDITPWNLSSIVVPSGYKRGSPPPL